MGDLTQSAGVSPTEATSFVGRRREVSQARRLLSRGRLVTLTGTGGIGKTRLALRIGASMRRSFRDGVWTVDLAQLGDGSLIAETIVETLRIQDASSRPALEVLQDHLSRMRLLLILDNCEHLLQHCAELVGHLLRAAPGLRILATSRQSLGVIGETPFEVSGLPVPEPDSSLTPKALAQAEAVSLFTDRAAAALASFQLTADTARPVARICRHLEGIPLAIELAATRMRTLTAEELLERLEDRFALLVGGSDTGLPRHRTLRATIDWSHDLCSPQEQLLWSRLSVFSGSFDLEAAEEVCSSPGILRSEVLELIAGLVDKSILLSLGEGGPTRRYRLLETLRQYGQERLAASGTEDTLREQHCDWYRRLAEHTEAESNGPDQQGWLMHMHADLANCRAALEHSLSRPGQARNALAIAADLWTFWLAAGAFTEARHWLDQALARETQDSPQRAKALWVLGWFMAEQGDTEQALQVLAQARKSADRAGDRLAQAWATTCTAQAVLFHGDVAGAVGLHYDGLEKHQALSDPLGTAVALIGLTYAASLHGDPRATGFAEQLFAHSEEIGNPWVRSYALWITGEELRRQGRMSQALGLFRESLRFQHKFGDRLATAYCVETLAWGAGNEGNHERAAQLLGMAQSLWRSVGASVSRYGHLLPLHECCAAQARQALGEAAYHAAFAQGEALPLEAAYALGEQDGSPSEDSRDPLSIGLW
ncbi:ATP-binding protein [Streptomyces sp. NBC_01092]|uniref:ATP-binding protein n=1 Tax=Streptomyces sp. NBC_01092 TaxID=2903748 RepID=UPI00386DC7C1|nr:NB-ARC domain-containing protein [Streptomyces sp. NBC_01092]